MWSPWAPPTSSCTRCAPRRRDRAPASSVYGRVLLQSVTAATFVRPQTRRKSKKAAASARDAPITKEMLLQILHKSADASKSVTQRIRTEVCVRRPSRTHAPAVSGCSAPALGPSSLPRYVLHTHLRRGAPVACSTRRSRVNIYVHRQSPTDGRKPQTQGHWNPIQSPEGRMRPCTAGLHTCIATAIQLTQGRGARERTYRLSPNRPRLSSLHDSREARLLCTS